ncbi:ribonuclease H-like domain-containing protein [Spinellus fusiger]|nr:ribonuclease H-like domain-containing protein [Spinellus fusiger]
MNNDFCDYNDILEQEIGRLFSIGEDTSLILSLRKEHGHTHDISSEAGHTPSNSNTTTACCEKSSHSIPAEVPPFISTLKNTSLENTELDDKEPKSCAIDLTGESSTEKDDSDNDSCRFLYEKPAPPSDKKKGLARLKNNIIAAKSYRKYRKYISPFTCPRNRLSNSTKSIPSTKGISEKALVEDCESDIEEITDHMKTVIRAVNKEKANITDHLRRINSAWLYSNVDAMKIQRRIKAYHELLVKDPITIHTAYVDGSVINKKVNSTSYAFAGIGVYWGTDDSRNISEPCIASSSSCNDVEFTAVVRAVEICGDLSSSLRIETDSIFCLELIAENRIPDYQPFRELMVKLRLLLSKRQACVYFRKVPAHNGITGNEIADLLAKRAAKEQLIRCFNRLQNGAMQTITLKQ